MSRFLISAAELIYIAFEHRQVCSESKAAAHRSHSLIGERRQIIR